MVGKGEDKPGVMAWVRSDMVEEVKLEVSKEAAVDASRVQKLLGWQSHLRGSSSVATYLVAFFTQGRTLWEAHQRFPLVRHFSIVVQAEPHRRVWL